MTTALTEPFPTRDAFDEAVAAARVAASAYYDTDVVTMPDADYDALVDRIAASVSAHPEWDDQGLTTVVAAGASAGGDVTHPTAMLSLDKARTREDVEAFIARLGGATAAVEVKLDGLAVRAEYRAGRLTLVATRGDGATGEDVTAQAVRGAGVAGLPATVAGGWSGEVRGEVYMTDADFATANVNRVAAGGKAFVNSRNATAGSLRNVDATYPIPMSFAAYDVSGDVVDTLGAHTDRMGHAAGLGFTTAYQLTGAIVGRAPLGVDAAEVLAVVDGIGERRAGLGFPIDGAVIKADDTAVRDRLGLATRTPYWATAVKYPPDTAFSTLRAIEVAVGRTGRASFRGVIDPVFVGGTTITYASLHNAPWIVAEGLGIGMRVAVVRAGDVIPRATAAVGERPEGFVAWQPPVACPQCGEPWDTSSLLWRCHTPACSVTGRITYAASRDVWDIDGLGEEVATAFVEAGLVTTVADLFDLTAEQVAGTQIGVTPKGAPRLIGAAVAARIMAGIASAKAQPLHRTICALGIRHTGRSVSRWLAARFRSMDALRAATVDEIADIDKMGQIKARHVVEGLAELGPIIDRLAASGLTMAIPDDGGDKPLAGRTFVVSGPVPGYTRTTVNERIEALGGTATSSVSKNTTALVTAETDTTKAKKAAQLGIQVIDPAEFATMLA